MPFRLDEHTAKIQFMTSARTPSLVYKACIVTGLPSNTAYIQRAVAEALSRDLKIPLQTLLDELPPLRGASTVLFGGTRKAVNHGPGPGNTVQQVK